MHILIPFVSMMSWPEGMYFGHLMGQYMSFFYILT